MCAISMAGDSKVVIRVQRRRPSWGSYLCFEIVGTVYCNCCVQDVSASDSDMDISESSLAGGGGGVGVATATDADGYRRGSVGGGYG